MAERERSDAASEFDRALASVRRKQEIERCKNMAPKKDISASMALITTPEMIKMVRNLRNGDRRKRK
jgi:hypothetical protein